MRFAATLLMLGMALAWPVSAHAEGSRLHWPVSPRPVVTRGFDAPSPNWNRGHRGVDLAATPQQPVYAAGPGTVVFAGVLAGRPVVSLAHPGGLRTSYEPVQAAVRPGQTVGEGQLLGTLLAGGLVVLSPTLPFWTAALLSLPAAIAAFFLRRSLAASRQSAVDSR